MKKAVSIFLVLAMAVGCFAGCGSKEAKKDADKFYIGGIGPTTGDAAIYGTAVMNGAQIAVDEINEAGGINGKKIEFNFQDDQSDAEKSVNAYNTLKDWGMQVLMGTVTTTPCVAVADKTAQDNMFEVTPSASSTDVIAGDNVFQVCFTDPNQGTKSAQYIGENKVVAEEAFTADSKTDFSTQLKKAQDGGAELVFLPIYYTEASIILTQADQMGYQPKFFGCDGLDGLLAVKNFDTKLAEGVMLLTPFAADATDDLTKKFVKEYKDKYDEVPNQFAADAYDAIYAIKAAMEEAKVTPDMSVTDMGDALKSAMTKVTIDGLTGDEMSWSESGEVNKDPKAVVIENGEYVGM